MDIILASNNQHKLKELSTILGEKFDRIFSLQDKGINIDIEETGKTFLDNALIKAKAIAELTNMPAVSDDSGLCVDALDGAPGVYSARFAGEPCNDTANNTLLLTKLRALEQTQPRNRKAHFCSVVVLYYPDGKYIFGQGTIDGHIIDDYRGTNGFGYDPLFFCDQLGKTFAEASAQEKNSCSHRSKALADLLTKL